MDKKLTYEELEQRSKEIEKTVVELKSVNKKLKLMQEAVASSINAIGITDLQGKMIYVNDSCIRMWGYDHENEILGRSLSEFWEGEGVFNTIKELQEKGEASGEDIGKRKDGSLIDVQFSASIFNDELGNPAYMFGSFFDVTDRRRAEETLRESEEKLARSRKMESMGLLAGGVAHDLNNVLSGIVSIPELILMDLPEDSKLKKPIKIMQESGHRAVTIVQDLLTMARGVAITKEPLIFKKLRIFNEMNMVNYHKRKPIFGTHYILYNPIKGDDKQSFKFKPFSIDKIRLSILN